MQHPPRQPLLSYQFLPAALLTSQSTTNNLLKSLKAAAGIGSPKKADKAAAAKAVKAAPAPAAAAAPAKPAAKAAAPAPAKAAGKK